MHLVLSPAMSRAGALSSWQRWRPCCTSGAWTCCASTALCSVATVPRRALRWHTTVHTPPCSRRGCGRAPGEVREALQRLGQLCRGGTRVRLVVDGWGIGGGDLWQTPLLKLLEGAQEGQEAGGRLPELMLVSWQAGVLHAMRALACERFPQRAGSVTLELCRCGMERWDKAQHETGCAP